jgi:hypothetical protein
MGAAGPIAAGSYHAHDSDRLDHQEHLSTLAAHLEQENEVTPPRLGRVLEAVIEEFDVQARESRARPMSSSSTINPRFRLSCGPQT